MGFEEVNINLASINIDEQRLVEFIAQMITAKPDERNKLLLGWN
jgi:hypothetical protein